MDASIQTSKVETPTPVTQAASFPQKDSQTSGWLARGFEFALLIFVIALGIALRVAHFFRTGSFFYDEACVALNLVTRHPWQLFKPLAYNQAAAPGFLLLEKFLIHFFGTGELVFRLPSLLGSIAVLALIAIFCEKLFERSTAILAVAILAASPLAITFASELKPYSTDAALTLWMMLRLRSLLLDPTAKRWLLLCVSGVGALLFSQAIIFVLLSVGLVLIIWTFRKTWGVVPAGLVAAIWSGVFLFLYLTVYRHEGNTFYMQTWWSSYILSVFKPQFHARAINALHNLSIFSLDSLHCLRGPLGRAANQGALILIPALGLYLAVKRVGVTWAAALALPYAAVIMASVVGLFPIAPRLLLFIIPLLAILTAVGAESLIVKALPPGLLRICYGLIVLLVIGNGVRLMYVQQQTDFPRVSSSLISQIIAAPDCPAVYVFAELPVWEFYTRGVGIEGMPTEETYRRIVDRNSDRAFAKNPKPPLPEGLMTYHLGCKPVILGERTLPAFVGYAQRRMWARSELMRVRNSGARDAYLIGELFAQDDLNAVFDEAESMGAGIRTLGGGHPFLGYLAKIEFPESTRKAISPSGSNP